MQTQPLVNEAQMESERLRSLSRVFQSADRTLTGENITCDIGQFPGIAAPAFSDGVTITLNLPHIGSVDTTDDIIKVTGLNYHELSHVMFSPRNTTEFSRECRARGWTHEANVLEDQRIETLLTSMYPSTAPYFVNVVMNYCIANPQDWPTAYALLYGRKYLPQAVRDQFKSRFEKPELVQELERIIDRYRTIVFPNETKIALRLVEKLHDLMLKLQHPSPNDPFGHSTGRRPEISRGKPMNGADQESASEWVDYRDEEREEKGNDYDPQEADADSDDNSDDAADSGDLSDDFDGEGTDSGSDDESDDDDGVEGDWDTQDTDDEGDVDDSVDGDQGDEDADYGQDAGDDFGDSQIGSGDSSEPSDSDGDNSGDQGEDVDGGVGGEGAGDSGGGDIPPSVPDNDFEDMMNEVADLAASLPQVQEDAKQKERAARDGMGGLPNIDLQDYTEHTIGADFAFASRRFEKELLNLWVDSDPGYHSHKSSGRINLGRAMRGEPLDTIWDQWDEGKTEATDIEMVVLFDVSGSMNQVMGQSSQILWAIKKSVERIGGDVTVISFSDTALLMYGKDDKIKGTSYRSFGSVGGTDPDDAIREAAMIFHGSKRHHKIALFVTDGDWNQNYGTSSSDTPNNKIMNWNAHGIITACAYLSTGYAARLVMQQPLDIATMTPAERLQKFHNCQTVAAIDDPDGLVALAKGIVKQAMQN